MEKAVINKEGYIVNKCVLIVNGKTYDYELKNDEQIVDRCILSDNFVKPRWNGSAWIEGATDEEIEAHKEENKTTEKEPSEQEKLNAQLLKDNAEQKILIAQLAKEVASMKGGTANV